MLNNALEQRASDVEATFRVRDGLYLMGALERGVTLYSQQVRAHNLAWALWELHRSGQRKTGDIAVIGGGAGGLTLTAALLSIFGGAVRITLFERLWDLCPLQQGSDGRWLHPRIYDWPNWGSRAPGASLPICNWSEGRASDVARNIVRGFGEFCQEFATAQNSLKIFIGLRNITLQAGSLTIDWVGTRAEQSNAFFQRGTSEGNSASFDTVVLTTGFGLERSVPTFNTPYYWRNEQLGQPDLSGAQRTYVISGYGDGALVDLCRLTIERYRQDTILYELFEIELEQVEGRMRADLAAKGRADNLFEYFRSIEGSYLALALVKLAARIRKDTSVILHISGKERKVQHFVEIFGPTSSRLNRLLTYMLYRCGAFHVSVSELDACVKQYAVANDAVLCRHGADTMAYLQSYIADFDQIGARIGQMKNNQAQTPVRHWEPGAFPIISGGMQR